MKNILFIAKLSSFQTQNSPNRYYFLKYLESKANIRIINDNYSTNLKNWLEQNKNEFRPDIIIYYFLTRTKVFSKINILDFKRTISLYRIPSIMIFEDSHYIKLVNEVYKKYNFNYLISLYNNKEIISKLNYYNIPVSVWNHYIDTSKFNNDNKKNKKYDFLFYGFNNKEIYPLRNKIYIALKQIQRSNKHIKIKIIEHNGEYNKRINPLPTQQELSSLISESRFSFATSSKYNLFIKKYIEIPLSGATVIGNIPRSYENLLTNNIININKYSSVNSIKKILLDAYNKKYIHIENKNKFFSEKLKSKYCYQQGYNDLNLIVNNILISVKDYKKKRKNTKEFKKMDLLPISNYSPSNLSIVRNNISTINENTNTNTNANTNTNTNVNRKIFKRKEVSFRFNI